MEYTYNGNMFIIEENEDAYISPYSSFMIENFPLNLCESQSLCDFGAGTGVLGIIASTYNLEKIVSIEINQNAYNLMIYNYQKNQIACLSCKFVKSSEMCFDYFDCILCNPASLPNVANINPFCNGGNLGMDMIIEAIDFAASHLTKNGKLYIIISSILPRSIAIEKMNALNLRYRIISKRKIPFRKHYEGIKEWVGVNRIQYDEMYYIDEEDDVFEELLLYEIVKDIDI